jgi:hypothetical protein
MNPLYRIAIALSLTSNHAGVLGALARHLFHVHTNVKEVAGSLNRFQAAIGGVIAVGVGGAMIDLMFRLTEKTKDYSAELVKLQTLGGPIPAMVASGEMENLAFKISREVPISPTEVMKIFGNAYSIFGKEPSVEMLKRLSQGAFVLKQQGVGGSGDVAQQMFDIMRAAERTGMVTSEYGGAADPKQMDRLLDLTTRITAATHGRVNPQTILGMAQQGGFTLRGLTDEGFYTMAIMAQAMGGQRAGTAQMALWQQMSGGPAMFNRTAAAMAKMGLIDPSDIVKKGGFGRVGLTDEAAQRLTKLVAHDPMEFATYVNKRFEALGITDPDEKARLITQITARQTGGRFVGEMTASELQMIAERMRIAQAMGVLPSLEAIMKGSVAGNLDALTAAWDRFTQALAGPLTEPTIKLLDSMRGVLLDLGDWARNNPELVRKLAIAFTALGVALTVLGGAAIIGAMLQLAGTGGLIFALAAGIGALFAAFGGNSPNEVQGKINDALQGKFAFPTDIEVDATVAKVFKDLGDNLKNAILGIPDYVASAITTAFTSIGDMIKRAVYSTMDRRAIVGPDRGFAGPGGLPPGFQFPPKKSSSPSYDLFNVPSGGASLGGPSLAMPASAISTGRGPTAIHIPIKLDIDGRTLADAMSHQLADLYEFPSQSPYYNGMSGHTPGDHPGMQT